MREQIKRYLLLLLGLYVNSLGIAFITRADLGTSPISSVPYTLSLGFSPTLGMFTLYMSLVLVLLQVLLLRKTFPLIWVLQIPFSFFFSCFIDLSMDMLSFLQTDAYLLKLLYLLIGCGILGTGVYLEMAANVVMLPGEAFVCAVSLAFHTDFGKTKVAFDSAMVLLAGVISLLLFHKLAGIREGTVLAALLVGTIARFFNRRISFLGRLLQKTPVKAESSAE